MPDGRQRIAVALDASERGRILELARLVAPESGAVSYTHLTLPTSDLV